MSLTPHWDIVSMLLYIVMGIIGAFSLYIVKRREKLLGYKQSLSSIPYISWSGTWIIVAIFRYIDVGFGGADAITYVNYFEISLDDYIPEYYATHYDILYVWFNQLIRLFTSDYHIFFLFVYGILIFAYILFLNELCPTNTNFVPFILVFYIYLRGFNTIRTNLGAALIMIGIVLLYRKRFVWAYIVAFSSFFIQKASILYALFLPFSYFYKRNKMTFKHCIVLSLLAGLAGIAAQGYIIRLEDMGIDLGGAYASYARKSLNSSFFDEFWKITFEQLLLGIGMFLFNKTIRKDIDSNDEVTKQRMNFIWTVCMFDFICIPITYVLSIWRGYEYLYLARLIMWGELIRAIQKNSSYKSRGLIAIITPLFFIAWIIFRVYNTWEESYLMPYILEFFVGK